MFVPCRKVHTPSEDANRPQSNPIRPIGRLSVGDLHRSHFRFGVPGFLVNSCWWGCEIKWDLHRMLPCWRYLFYPGCLCRWKVFLDIMLWSGWNRALGYIGTWWGAYIDTTCTMKLCDGESGIIIGSLGRMEETLRSCYSPQRHCWRYCECRHRNEVRK